METRRMDGSSTGDEVIFEANLGMDGNTGLGRTLTQGELNSPLENVNLNLLSLVHYKNMLRNATLRYSEHVSEVPLGAGPIKTHKAEKVILNAKVHQWMTIVNALLLSSEQAPVKIKIMNGKRFCGALQVPRNRPALRESGGRPDLLVSEREPASL